MSVKGAGGAAGGQAGGRDARLLSGRRPRRPSSSVGAAGGFSNGACGVPSHSSAAATCSAGRLVDDCQRSSSGFSRSGSDTSPLRMRYSVAPEADIRLSTMRWPAMAAMVATASVCTTASWWNA